MRQGKLHWAHKRTKVSGLDKVECVRECREWDDGVDGVWCEGKRWGGGVMGVSCTVYMGFRLCCLIK